ITVFMTAMSAIGIDYVLHSNNVETASFLWTLSAFISVSLILLFSKERNNIIPTLKKHWKILLIVGILLGLSMLGWFFSIQTIGPEISSFLGRIGTLVLVILSVIFLKETFNFGEAFGAALVLMGVYIITFSPIDFLGWKVTYIVVGSSLYAISQLLIKKNIKSISPIIFTFTSSLMIFLTIWAYGFISGNLHDPNLDSLPVLVSVPLFSEVIAVILLTISYQHIGVGKSQIIRSTFPFIVVIYSYILYKTILLQHQFFAGTLIVVGAILLMVSRKRSS
ncbi:MAG: DMT family transporter, partial [Nanoarchaeota archaeon]